MRQLVDCLRKIYHGMNKAEVTRDICLEYVRRYGLTKKKKDILKQFGIDNKEIEAYT
jgi:hypothetical protein